ncbi:MAG: hypothetical protein KAS32_25120 [Candidatus Peribacteraceae bacterium]|nr:hypothetical protein [Candidatus Peribacteraceae bacterium]
MATVVTSQELATYMSVDHGTYEAQLNRALNAAELAVASECGALDLVQVEATETYEIKTNRNVLELRNGILRSVTSVSIDGTALDLDKVQSEYWVIAYTEGFSRGGTVIVVYKHGYADSDDMPPRLLEAVLQTAEWMFKEHHKGRTKTSERVDDYAVTFSSKRGVVVPDIVKDYVSEFTRARV